MNLGSAKGLLYYIISWHLYPIFLQFYDGIDKLKYLSVEGKLEMKNNSKEYSHK